MRKMVAVLLALVFVISLTTCAVAGDKKLKIGLSVQVTDGFYVSKYITTYNEIIEERGYDSVMVDCKFDTATQISQLDNLIAQKVDVIILTPNDPLAVIPSLEQAKEAGIPVIAVQAEVDASARPLTLGYSGADVVSMGAAAGELMNEALGGQGKIVCINGTPGNSYVDDLNQGFMSTLSKDIEILDTGDHGWDRSKSTAVMDNFLAKYDEIDGAWGSDDNTALGILNAVKASDRDIKVVGINGQGEAFDSIKKDGLFGTVIHDPAAAAHNAFAILDLYLAGEETPPFMFTASPKITKENVDQFEPAF